MSPLASVEVSLLILPVSSPIIPVRGFLGGAPFGPFPCSLARLCWGPLEDSVCGITSLTITLRSAPPLPRWLPGPLGGTLQQLQTVGRCAPRPVPSAGCLRGSPPGFSALQCQGQQGLRGTGGGGLGRCRRVTPRDRRTDGRWPSSHGCPMTSHKNSPISWAFGDRERWSPANAVSGALCWASGAAGKVLLRIPALSLLPSTLCSSVTVPPDFRVLLSGSVCLGLSLS